MSPPTTIYVYDHFSPFALHKSMDLRDRLKSMGVRPRVPGVLTPPDDGPGERQPAPSGDSTISINPQSNVPFQSRIGFSQTAFRIDQALPGTWHDTVDGACFAVERRFPVGQARGPVHLGS